MSWRIGGARRDENIRRSAIGSSSLQPIWSIGHQPAVLCAPYQGLDGQEDMNASLAKTLLLEEGMIGDAGDF